MRPVSYTHLAIGIYAEGVATVEGIDTAMKLGANHPMGPLALEMCIRDSGDSAGGAGG